MADFKRGISVAAFFSFITAGWIAGCENPSGTSSIPLLTQEEPLPSVLPTSPSSSSGSARTVRVYVAGESIERRNRFLEQPFLSDGRLNDRGGGSARNDTNEYGWMIPLADRLKLRNSAVTVQFVGSTDWSSGDDAAYSGTYPTGGPGRTSAISGSDVETWNDERRAELQARAYCYDVAFAARGGNDKGTDDGFYSTLMAQLIDRLRSGSSCQSNPIIYVTAHLPDYSGPGSTPTNLNHWYVDRVRTIVDGYVAGHPGARVHFIDMFTPFMNNQATTAFPSEVWFSGGNFDFAKIGRSGDLAHPRRLASIYAGEIAADQIDLNELLVVVP